MVTHTPTLIKSENLLEKFRHASVALIEERQQLLAKYIDLLKIDIEDIEGLPEAITAFNQLLTDYAAIGHFELFEPLDNAELRDESVRSVLSEIKVTLNQETDGFLRFSERYGKQQLDSSNLSGLVDDLEVLGLLMAQRFEKEDQFIELLAL